MGDGRRRAPTTFALVTALVMALVMALLAGCGAGSGTRRPADSAATAKASARPSETATDGGHRFVFAYTEPQSAAVMDAAELMRRHRMAERWADTANRMVTPPETVTIVVDECGMANAFYDLEAKRITICYEMADYLLRLFARPTLVARGRAGAMPHFPSRREAENRVVGALDGIYFHELGHGLVDLYRLPVTGREEDAVDQLSALILINAAKAGQEQAIFNTIEALSRMAQEEGDYVSRDAHAGQHSMTGQRYYTWLCYLYGSDHNRFLDLVASGELPLHRASGCEQEYDQMMRSWTTLLQPYLKTLASPSPRS
jgi:hypothetical protein